MKYVTITLFLIMGLAIFGGGLAVGALTGIKLSEVTPTPAPAIYPTGNQVLGVLQDYRLSEHLPRFEVSDVLCDNIAERWKNYNEHDSHEGFQDFVNREYPAGTQAAEILVTSTLRTPTAAARDMVDQWVNSPSHSLYIHKNSKICVYSAEGKTVAILSN